MARTVHPHAPVFPATAILASLRNSRHGAVLGTFKRVASPNYIESLSGATLVNPDAAPWALLLAPPKEKDGRAIRTTPTRLKTGSH